MKSLLRSAGLLLAVSALGAVASAWPSTTTSVGAATVGTEIGGAADVSAAAVRLGTQGLAFPMQATPRCEILSNFGEARSGGRAHEGIDMLSTLGQEVYAATSGILVQQYFATGPQSSLSGNAWMLRSRTGDEYFYAHLSAFAPGLALGSTVTAGQLIGAVGDTGNPGPGNYHLHFEVHPAAGDAVDPLTVLTVPAGCRVY